MTRRYHNHSLLSAQEIGLASLGAPDDYVQQLATVSAVNQLSVSITVM